MLSTATKLPNVRVRPSTSTDQLAMRGSGQLEEHVLNGGIHLLDRPHRNVLRAKDASRLGFRGCRIVVDGDMEAFSEKVHVRHMRATRQRILRCESLVGNHLENRAPKLTPQFF